jgi:hypothetical protein
VEEVEEVEVGLHHMLHLHSVTYRPDIGKCQYLSHIQVLVGT